MYQIPNAKQACNPIRQWDSRVAEAHVDSEALGAFVRTAMYRVGNIGGRSVLERGFADVRECLLTGLT